MKKSWISLFLLICIYNCADPYFANLHSESDDDNAEYKFVMEYENTGITKDNNDYFHLTINRHNWQTFYRVRGTVYKDNEPAENIKFYWESNLYWVSDIDGIEVPTSNTTSVSGSDGEISNIIAPVQIMAGDTLILNYVYFDWIYESDTYSGEMRFVLE